MTIDPPATGARSFVTRILPWLVGAAGLLIYAITINPWVSFLNLGMVAQTSGWSWRPELDQPLTSVLLYPFRWLPVSAIPLALNLFTALCAALVLVLLARSVALLRHDLAPDEPLAKAKPVSILTTRSAWIPPVLTAIVCGLQLTFWEHATSASGEMIDLLVFAYVIRCLLEFRIDPDQKWMSRCAFVYALGMANNWAMVGYSPVFVAAILRMKGLREFLNLNFLKRMTLWGLAGLSLYLALPLIYSVMSHGDLTFWSALKLRLKFQLHGLSILRNPSIRMLALTSLLPLFLLSIRWKSHTAQLGDDSPLGVFVTKATGHLMHGLFFGIAFWVALDPEFSPRHLHFGSAMLTYYYISALVFGYCAGYFLLFETSSASKVLTQLPIAAGVVLLCVITFLLLGRNLGQITVTNGHATRQFAESLYSDVPAGNSVVLSEDSRQLTLLRAELSVHHNDKNPLLVHTLMLPLNRYHISMAKQFPARWPIPAPTNSLGLMHLDELRGFVSKFATREPVVYLHPSSGLLMEPFVDRPRGFVHALTPCATNRPTIIDILPPQVIAENDRLWELRWTNGLESLSARIENQRAKGPVWKRTWARLLHLQSEKNLTASVLGAACSKALDDWGVDVQRAGHWKRAETNFVRAVALNPDNLSARINLLYNRRCQQGDGSRLALTEVEKEFQDLLAQYEDWPGVVNADGPVDEPTLLFKTGEVMMPGQNVRQAIRAFLRSSQLAPNWPAPKLWLGRAYIEQGKFERALVATDGLMASKDRLHGPGLADLLFCRVMGLRGLNQTNEATSVAEMFVRLYGEHDEVMATAAYLYGQSRQFELELAVLDELLKRDPTHVRWLGNEGLVLLQLSRFDAASATLTKALTLSPSDSNMRLFRAVAYLGANQLVAARNDYQELLKRREYEPIALFGLAEIAHREHDTNGMIQFYERYLSKANPQSPQWAFVTDRLNQAKSRQTQ